MLPRSIHRALLAGGTVLSLASLAFPQAPLPPAAETARLETIEDLSESLANEVLDLSGAVRDRDLSRVGAYFADSIEAPPFPSAPGEPRPQVKWISLHGWAPPSGAPPDPRPIPHARVPRRVRRVPRPLLGDRGRALQGARRHVRRRRPLGARREGAHGRPRGVRERDDRVLRVGARRAGTARVGARHGGRAGEEARVRALAVHRLQGDEARLAALRDGPVLRGGRPRGRRRDAPALRRAAEHRLHLARRGGVRLERRRLARRVRDRPAAQLALPQRRQGPLPRRERGGGHPRRGERGGAARGRLRQRRRHGPVHRHGRRADPPREPPGARREARLRRRLAGGGRGRLGHRLQRRRRRRQRRRPARPLRRLLQPLRPGHPRRLVQGDERHAEPLLRQPAGRRLPRGGAPVGRRRPALELRRAVPRRRRGRQARPLRRQRLRREGPLHAPGRPLRGRGAASAASSTPATAWASPSATSTTTAGSTCT